MDNLSIGNRIYRLRSEFDLCQADIADICGVSRQSVGKWENGIVTPCKSAIQKLCVRFGVESEYFTTDNFDLAMEMLRSLALARAECAATVSSSAESEKPQKKKISKGLVITLTVCALFFAAIIIWFVFHIVDSRKYATIVYSTTIHMTYLEMLILFLAASLVVAIISITVVLVKRRGKK